VRRERAVLRVPPDAFETASYIWYFSLYSIDIINAFCPLIINCFILCYLMVADARRCNFLWPRCNVDRPEYPGISHVHVGTPSGICSLIYPLHPNSS